MIGRINFKLLILNLLVTSSLIPNLQLSHVTPIALKF